ncbi:hypothetical protein C8R43DRAFT_186340 [Mycena crocata]|nr:hypothetical protein C8R43DRAFT_186340 [Mycena crocata]
MVAAWRYNHSPPQSLSVHVPHQRPTLYSTTMKSQSVLFAIIPLASLFTGIGATNVPRQSPTLTSVSGIESPTSTDAAVQAEYQKALQNCGPDLAAATQAAIQQYNNERTPGLPDVTNTSDPDFIQWAGTDPSFQGAQGGCAAAEIEMENGIDSVRHRDSATASSNSPTADRDQTLSNPKATTTSPTGASSTPLPGDGMVHRAKPVALFAGLLGLLAWLR